MNKTERAAVKKPKRRPKLRLRIMITCDHCAWSPQGVEKQCKPCHDAEGLLTFRKNLRSLKDWMGSA